MQDAQIRRNTTLTFARPLSAEDVTRLNGMLTTPLGPVPFSIGDFLTRNNTRGKWVISKTDMETQYQRVLGSSDSWAIYRLLDESSVYTR